MSPRILSFRQVIEQERRRWMPFRRALSTEDQEACDRVFADAAQPPQADIQLGWPWRFDVVVMAVLLAHEQRLEQIWMHLEAIRAETHLRDGNCPEGR
jgi:hypothetical protein